KKPTVGRSAELATLMASFDAAARGQGAFVCVTGESGLGKTTFVEHFLEELGERSVDFAVARGRCSERLAGTEAYLPFLEALESLLRSVHGTTMTRVMKDLAPAWYAQLIPASADELPPSERKSVAQDNALDRS